RFIQTCQGQLEAEVRAAEILTLDQLNQVLAAWLETAYHRQAHSETGQPPHERYHQDSRLVRHVDLAAVLSFFHQRVSRKIDEDFSDVRINNLFFAVDPQLRGDRVIVQFDPFSKLDEVQLYSPTGTYLGLGRRYQRQPGSHPQPRGRKSPAEPVTPHYLDALRADHDALHQQQRSGIDYHSARQRSVWSLAGFAGTLARLLGRKGGVSSLSTQEMEILAAFHSRHDRLTEGLLRQAFTQAESPTIPQILFHLQSLLHERNA
ncbi:MAG: hypothetical protein WAM94_12505, partial [Chromatiaceae bacterium]